MQPTVGRIVHYRLSAGDIERIQMRRAKNFGGNHHRTGDLVPLIIVRVWPDEYTASNSRYGISEPDGTVRWVDVRSHFGVNGQALLDGNDSLWVCSAPEGDEPGMWSWAPKV